VGSARLASRLAGPKRFQPVQFPFGLCPDLVIVSPDHYDHLDYPTVRASPNATFRSLTSLGVGAHLEAWGVQPDRIFELDWWESQQVPTASSR
jgi:L-ascorbate metabolism protein UlaG (beta-lactamase superfamily)